MENEEVKEVQAGEEEIALENSNIKIADDVVAVIAGVAVSEVQGVYEMSGGFAGGISEVFSGKKNIEEAAPVRTGRYKKSWRIKKIREKANSLDVVIHSSNRYQLAHLLEYGHAKRGGGRVAGKPHIEPAAEKGEQDLINAIEEKLK